MRFSRKSHPRAFTLLELMVTVTIAIILAVMGGISISSRMRTSRLENAAQTLVSDFSSARATALFKGCPVRIIYCNNPLCTATTGGLANATASKVGGNVVGSGTPSLYYGFLRLSSNDPTNSCYSETGFVANALDGYDNWDYDRKPQKIALGLAFGSIYTGTNGAPNVTDWGFTGAASSESLWWKSTDGSLGSSTAVSGTSGDGDPVVAQIQFDDCDPSSTTVSCPAYMISNPAGGELKLIKCATGGRGAGNSDNCFSK